MSVVQDHTDIEKLPLEIDGIPVRETIREIFRNPDNGTPDNISNAGCLALALKSNEIGGQEKGHVVWNEWRDKFPVVVDVDGFVKNEANFCCQKFIDLPISFCLFIFGDYSNFSKTQWGPFANFTSASWGVNCSFRGAQWDNGATFFDAEWGEAADFKGAQWDNYANFRGARWGKGAHFEGAQWGSAPCFLTTEWGDGVKFCGSDWNDLRFVYANDDQMKTAKEWAERRSMSPQTFPDGIDFSGAKFLGKADFSNRRFKGRLRFSRLPNWCNKPNPLDLEGRTIFGEVPIFHGCELHQDTSFEGAVFPPATGSEETARGYRTLKLAFSKQQSIREEQRFFRLEMEEETLRETGLKRWLFKAYKTFSDYGFSVTRPLLLLIAAWLAFAQIYGSYSDIQTICLLGQAGCDLQGNWLSFSLQQALPLPGFEKLDHAIQGVSVGWLFLHKTISLATLFLIGLALRNLFKLK